MNMLSLDGMLEICFLLRASSMEKLINFLLKLYTLETLTEVLILPLLTGKEVSRQVKQLLWTALIVMISICHITKMILCLFVSFKIREKCVYGRTASTVNLSITLELPIDKMEYILKQIHRNSFIEVKDMKLFLILNVPDELVDDMLNCSDRRLVKAQSIGVMPVIILLSTYNPISSERFSFRIIVLYFEYYINRRKIGILKR